MEWLEKKLEEYSEKQKQVANKKKVESHAKKESEKANVILGQSILKEIVIPNLKEIKKYFNNYGFKCEIKEIKVHIEHLNLSVIGRVELYLTSKNFPYPNSLKISQLLNAPKFNCESYFIIDKGIKNDDLNYEGLDNQVFEKFIKKFVDKIL